MIQDRTEAMIIRQGMTNTDTAEAVKTLEALDENSLVLAKTYLSALMDRHQLEKAREAGRRRQGLYPARLGYSSQVYLGEAYTPEIRLASRMATGAPAIERIDGQQVFGAVRFLRQKTDAAGRKGHWKHGKLQTGIFAGLHKLR